MGGSGIKIGKIIGNYRVLKQIAEGGFGTTLLAEHTVLGMPVCIKLALPPIDEIAAKEDEKILFEEAKAIWDLRHYSIPSMRDIIKLPNGAIALVMSYIPGPTLTDLITKHKHLEPEHVAWITDRTINVLRYLHYHGVVHGDIKPPNIIVQPESHQVVVVDYGLSLIRPNRSSSAKGYTPYFASPEQERGEVLLPESDFYNLGISMIYALGGNVETRKVPKNTPAALCAFIDKLLVFDIRSRPNWQKEDLQESFQQVRMQAFGRRFSEMKPLPV